jgi:hypothetical protein
VLVLYGLCRRLDKDVFAQRVTFGPNLVVSGAHPRVVQELMRHSDLKLTMKLYTDAGQLPVGAALARLPWNSLRPLAAGVGG